ncbi:MAG: GNAT family N-acetyltransferase [Burkholderiales bacterium PBB5]|nr:MAG: GNAT family N-acetyltransferase [Burkholderiales bacterium PBB5]
MNHGLDSPAAPAPEVAGPTPPGGQVAERFAPWIPIRSLAPRHRDRIADHLIGLPERDRYLRFGYPASDAQIRRYVDGLDFDLDEVFGVFNRRLQLIALAHLAYPRPDSHGPKAAEFGGSVVPQARGRGYGARLFEHAMLHARNRGLDTMFIHALSENTTMLRIARRAGARVERDGSESDAFLKLPQDTLASQVEQWVGDGAAEIDYRLKQQARMMDNLIDAIGEVKAGIGSHIGRAAKD